MKVIAFYVQVLLLLVRDAIENDLVVVEVRLVRARCKHQSDHILCSSVAGPGAESNRK